jgi:UDP-2,3-diacylglucosamine hydrolase
MTHAVIPAVHTYRGDCCDDNRPVFFISDLHLTPERPAPVRLFERFMDHVAPQARALYILGDFFEAWVGDDDLALPFHTEIALRIKQLVDSGVAVFFLPGNRDFLAGHELAHASGWTPLPDPTYIDLHGTLTLISHGDAYCTDDVAYQAFRKQVRNQGWQAQFLAKPLDERRAIAKSIREQSEHAKAGKKPDIMDVNAEAVYSAFLETGLRRIIHGHTHRPAQHMLSINEQPCERWVLPDWYETGGYLSCDSGGCQLETVR